MAVYELIPRFLFTYIDIGEFIPWLLIIIRVYELIPIGFMLSHISNEKKKQVITIDFKYQFL